MKVGSLFSGIGGLDRAAELAGATVVWQSEIDPYACRVLAKHWPDVPNLGDITTIDWSTVEPVDVICGGYPCQPFSLAGVRRGESDPRHLWPHFAEALRVLRPPYALLENVPGHRSLGFGRVLGDLAELGFDAEWDSVRASDLGAPHRRERVFVVAHSHDTRPQGLWTQHGLRPDSTETETRRRAWRATEPDVGRVAHGVPHRVDRLRALGNAVVPQVAEHIFRRLMAAA